MRRAQEFAPRLFCSSFCSFSFSFAAYFRMCCLAWCFACMRKLPLLFPFAPWSPPPPYANALHYPDCRLWLCVGCLVPIGPNRSQSVQHGPNLVPVAPNRSNTVPIGPDRSQSVPIQSVYLGFVCVYCSSKRVLIPLGPHSVPFGHHVRQDY